MSDLPEGPWINIGSGPHAAPGWVGIDGSWQAWLSRRPALARIASWLTGRAVGGWPREVMYRDVRRGLGYGSASVAVVFSSHCVEHLYRDEALALLCEVHRVLKAGGVCRIVVPDVAAVVGWYLEHRAGRPAGGGKASSDLLLEMLSLRPQGAPRRTGLLGWYRGRTDLDLHKWMYDGDGLIALFREAGFATPAVRPYLDSAIPAAALGAVERADRVENGAGVCVEARR